QVKQIFDPQHLLNTGKIVDAPKMNEHLRYSDQEEGEKVNCRYDLHTIFDFSDTNGILRAIEKCNGSADCKKSHLFSGAMCPSYQATLNEKNATRARANILREFLTHSTQKNPFDHKEIKNALDTCLACKACKSECPSNVDMTKLRAEFLYHYYQQHPLPFRNWLIGHYPLFNQWATPFSALYNFIITNKTIAPLFKKMMGFAPQRSLPTIHSFTLKKWAQKNIVTIEDPVKTIYFFNDEFTNTNDVQIGIAAIQLLQKLHYQVRIINNKFSGRTYLSKGLLKKAKKLAQYNVSLYSLWITEDTPLIGLEPSAILSFRDEYPELVNAEFREKAKKLSKNAWMIDEFLADEFSKGHISKELFTKEKKEILFHSHCYQKALSDPAKSIDMMQIPENYHVTEIKSGCCGMAGAFGYEKEHYELSMQVGNLALFPSINNKNEETIVTATGTSCRHQIKDGTGEKTMHPIEVLFEAML
ncbi:MAG: 4Fe-4S dicluster domain-containing protein, partial [Bacteroidales bacterium]